MNQHKIKVGIFFGGCSREREISFAGGRTVYDNLDKSIFDPIPIFLDSTNQPILLDWQYLYKGSIRDFYPPQSVVSGSKYGFQLYDDSLPNTGELRKQMAQAVGKHIEWNKLPSHIDAAFLCLHGAYGEDGRLQGLLDMLGIPFTGSGVRASSIGIDKAFQKRILANTDFDSPPMLVIDRNEWQIEESRRELFDKSLELCDWPLVIRPSQQGSSIGVKIIDENQGFHGFKNAVNDAFFVRTINSGKWKELSWEERVEQIRDLIDIRSGLGLPMQLQHNKNTSTIHLPEVLLSTLNSILTSGETAVHLIAAHTEHEVVVEKFLTGKEFSCIVLKLEDGKTVALPPTEIVKGSEVFDYRSKYLPGLSRKETPIDLPEKELQDIRRECSALFDYFGFDTYARIDGFIDKTGKVTLNDPNTTSGMLPSSFFFHQAAEVGLSPSRFLTYILRISLQERKRQAMYIDFNNNLQIRIDEMLSQQKKEGAGRLKVAVIMGGYSYERHISVESGRNIFEKLSSSVEYDPIPVFLTKDKNGEECLFELPLNLMLKDNADDIRSAVLNFKTHPVIEAIRTESKQLIEKYSANFEAVSYSYESLADKVDFAFIALHGRPGEDGEVQKKLEAVGLPYNGSSPDSAAITIDKFKTLELLHQAGFKVDQQPKTYGKDQYLKNPETVIANIESRFDYPFIAKPVDDGCSSAVMKIKNNNQLKHYLEVLFRESAELTTAHRNKLNLSLKEEFPYKEQVLIEQLIVANGADRFLEITGGLLTHKESDGSTRYEMFEPSEALAGGEVLSLEEKFLAGEGQNITPARFADSQSEYERISSEVKNTLRLAAELLNVEGYARIDAFVRIFANGNVETIIIEVNSLPGMTPATAIFHQAALNGYKPLDFIDKVIEFGMGR